MDSVKTQTKLVEDIQKSLQESQAIIEADLEFRRNPFRTEIVWGKKINVLKKRPSPKDIVNARKSLLSLGKELETALVLLQEKKVHSVKIQNEYKENALKIFQEVCQVENKVADGNDFYFFFPGGGVMISYPESEIFSNERVVEQIQTEFGFSKEDVKIFGIEGKKFFEKYTGRQYTIRQNDSQESVPRFSRVNGVN